MVAKRRFADDRKPITDYRLPMAESRKPKAESRWPMADGRWPITDSRLTSLPRLRSRDEPEDDRDIDRCLPSGKRIGLARRSKRKERDEAQPRNAPKAEALKCSRPSAIGYRSSAIGHRLIGLSAYRPSAIGHRPSAHRLIGLSAIGHRPSAHRPSAHRPIGSSAIGLSAYRPSAHRPTNAILPR